MGSTQRYYITYTPDTRRLLTVGKLLLFAIKFISTEVTSPGYRDWTTDRMGNPQLQTVRATFILCYTSRHFHIAYSHLLGAINDVLLTYNLSYAFTSNTNVTGLLVQDLLSKAVGGTGQTDSNAVNYVDGALLGNDAEFWFYGGQAEPQLPPFPTKNSIMGYEAFQYGFTSSNFHAGFVPSRTIPGNFSQFVTYGGAARAPSENLAWYFSGATSDSGGILALPANDSTRPTKISNYLVTLDMSDQLFEKWNNQTLPPDIKGRASPEVVWVPVGVRGILVALGGVVFPEYATNDKSQNPTASVRNAPKCSPIPVYHSNGCV